MHNECTTLPAYHEPAKAKLNPKASSIKGLSCGYGVEDIESPLAQKARSMDKLVDELARGKKMENILRS